MGVVLNPDELQTFTLESDKGTPADKRVVFEVRTPTRRMRQAHAALRRKAGALQDEARKLIDAGDTDKVDAVNAQVEGVLIEMIRMGVVGWQNAGGKAFEPTADFLMDVLGSEADFIDLACHWPDAAAIREDDRKNSLSPRPTSADASAPTAVAESAETNPTPTNG